MGYDIESGVPDTGRLRFIEVMGRRPAAGTVSVTGNEIRCGLNKPDDFILAIVELGDGDAYGAHYFRRSFRSERDFGAGSVNYTVKDLLGRAEAPR